VSRTAVFVQVGRLIGNNFRRAFEDSMTHHNLYREKKEAKTSPSMIRHGDYSNAIKDRCLPGLCAIQNSHSILELELRQHTRCRTVIRI